MALKYLYVPSGVQAGTAYGVIPNSASADFSSFVSDTDGTRVDENGFITDVEANVPRLDYTSGGCPSLLLEPSSTNKIVYSEDFTQQSGTTWILQNNPTIEPNVEISPTGSLNGSYLKAPVSATSTSPRINHTFTTVSGQTYIGSVFVKKGNVDYMRILSTGASSTVQAYYNVSNGTLGTGGNSDKAEIEDYGNGWYRLILKIEATNSTSGALFYIQLAKGDNNPASTFDGTEKNIIFGGQLEQQAYATSYIPNYGTAAGVTRSADLGGSTGDISSAINEEEGVLFAYMAAPTSEAIVVPQWIILCEDSSTNSFISIRYSNAGDSIQVRYRANGGTAVQISTTSIDRSNFNKIAFRWKENDFSLWINGNLIQTQTTLDIITANNLNKFKFANAGNGQNLFGKVREIRIYDEYESDAEMVKLTTL